MGRPKSDNPKDIDVKVRIDKQLNERLLSFCAKHEVTRAEAIRAGVVMLLDDDEKE